MTIGDIDRIKQREKEFHEHFRDGGLLPVVDIERIRREDLSPCWETGVDRYSDDKMTFHAFIRKRGGWEGKCVLDYGCGTAQWAAYFVLIGARKAAGFDICETGIDRANERLERQGLQEKVNLFVMDASSLSFPDNEFELVIGHGVLHHAIKYPSVFEEMYRVMKPGSKAFFLENLADFPLWKLHWRIKGEVPQGDVPVFSKEIRRKAHMFSAVEIEGHAFLFAFKHFIWKANLGFMRRMALKTLSRMDDALFSFCPPLRRWGGFCRICTTN